MKFTDFLNEEKNIQIGRSMWPWMGNVPYFNCPDFSRSTVEIWNKFI